MIDKRMLNDTVTIQKVEGKDKWGKETYSAPIVLSSVKFDRETSYVGTGNNRSESKPSVLMIYPIFSPIELDNSYLNGKVNDGERDYIIRKIIPQYHPFKKEVLCYEVEVV
ncbi:minor capsid protein [Streptococcus pneumoniae]|nr:minor capsid protein [Streptococcus pneumoniae]